MSPSISDSNMTPEKTQAPIRYPSDLIDEEWEILQPILDELEPYTTGRPRTTDLREILNAIFYLNKTGCPWRHLPTDLPQQMGGQSNVKAPREPQNPIWNQGAMEASSLKEKEEVDTMGCLIIVRVFAANVFGG